MALFFDPVVAVLLVVFVVICRYFTCRCYLSFFVVTVRHTTSLTEPIGGSSVSVVIFRSRGKLFLYLVFPVLLRERVLTSPQATR